MQLNGFLEQATFIFDHIPNDILLEEVVNLKALLAFWMQRFS